MTKFQIGDILSSPAQGGEVRYEVIGKDSDRYQMHVLNGAMEGEDRWYQKKNVHAACTLVYRASPTPQPQHSAFRKPTREIIL